MKSCATTFCKALLLLVYLRPRSKFFRSQILILTRFYHVSLLLIWEKRAPMTECEMFTSANIYYISQRNWGRGAESKRHLCEMIWTETAL